MNFSPQALEILIREELCIGPLNTLEQRLLRELDAFIRNKLTPIMLKATPEEIQLIEKIYEALTSKKLKEGVQ